MLISTLSMMTALPSINADTNDIDYKQMCEAVAANKPKATALYNRLNADQKNQAKAFCKSLGIELK